MKPGPFPESNKTLTRPPSTTAEECSPLDVYSDGKYCISRWTMTWKERIRVLFTGEVWCWIWFGNTQPPVYIGAERPFMQDTAYTVGCRLSWSNFAGEKFSGVLREIDNYTGIVFCDDGKVRAVHLGKR